jgi:integron integrase
MSTKKGRKLLDEVRDVMRLLHYSIHTERTYCEWIRKFVLFHKMKSRDDLAGGEKKIEMFLTHLAVHGNVAPATQNQAMNALIFLYRKVLKQDLSEQINAVRASKKLNIPVVLTREETAKVLSLMAGTPQLITKLMYGSGLRISEAIRLRVKDIDYAMKTITVRSGKGDKDRVTTFPASVIPFLKSHLAKVKATHQNDLKTGYGEVYLPHALSRKYPNTAKEWGWQYVFPSGTLSKDPRSKSIRRHHIDLKPSRQPRARRG